MQTIAWFLYVGLRLGHHHPYII